MAIGKIYQSNAYRLSLVSYLSCGGDEQTEAVYGNIDCDTHSCEAQVTLPHDGLESFVQGLHDKDTFEILDYSHKIKPQSYFGNVAYTVFVMRENLRKPA